MLRVATQHYPTGARTAAPVRDTHGDIPVHTYTVRLGCTQYTTTVHFASLFRVHAMDSDNTLLSTADYCRQSTVYTESVTLDAIAAVEATHGARDGP